MTEPTITLQTAKDLGLSEGEFERIQQILGRIPNYAELSAFSVMWSDPCSYKNSMYWLKTLPREGKRLLLNAGEGNADMIDIGDGWACVFNIQSHNKPSATEPYQGAAAGAGSNLRKVFTTGARPMAILHFLGLGNIDTPHTQHLLKGVVRGIGDFGNAFGAPVVGGKTCFHDCYNQNILVNILSAGIVKIGETVSARADGPGNPVFLIGSATGKEGANPAGDPFGEKLLLEATLEAFQTGAIAGAADINTGGIICSAAEMCTRSHTGMRIDLDQILTRQAEMHPWEILLSESQERILIVGRRGMEETLRQVFEKWDLVCREIGAVTETEHLTIFQHGQMVVDIPANALTPGGGAPVYQREYAKPSYLQKIQQFNPVNISSPGDYIETARKMVASPNLASKTWIFEQYDSMGTNIPSDAAVIRIKDTPKALALTTGCNSTYVYADPYWGAAIALAEAARNIVCSGGAPLAISNSFNFGDPYAPEVYWQFVQAVKGIADACRKFNLPVAGNTVSFNNQSVFNDRIDPIYPTPVIGMVGILEDIRLLMPLGFQSEGDHIYMIGTPNNDIASSEYLRLIHGIVLSPAPRFDIEEELHIQQNIRTMIKDGYLESAHGISKGGLFLSLLECAMVKQLGFNVETDSNFRKDAYLFGEGQSRIIVTVTTDNEDDFVNYLNSHNVSFSKLGEVSGDRLIIDEEDFGSIEEWKRRYSEFLARKMES